MSRRCRGDRGTTTAIELPFGFAFLVLPVAWLMLVIPTWLDGQTVATTAAKEAATLYATAATPDEGEALAHAAVERSASNFDRSLTLVLSGEWCRGCSVTATVTVDIPAVVIPLVGSTGHVGWSSSSTARIDDFRNIGDAG